MAALNRRPASTLTLQHRPRPGVLQGEKLLVLASATTGGLGPQKQGPVHNLGDMDVKNENSRVSQFLFLFWRGWGWRHDVYGDRSSWERFLEEKKDHEICSTEKVLNYQRPGIKLSNGGTGMLQRPIIRGPVPGLHNIKVHWMELRTFLYTTMSPAVLMKEEAANALSAAQTLRSYPKPRVELKHWERCSGISGPALSTRLQKLMTGDIWSQWGTNSYGTVLKSLT